MSQRRIGILTFALLASLLAVTAMPVGALQTNTALGGIHTNDSDFSAATTLDSVEVNGTGDAADVELSNKNYNIAVDSGDGTAENDRALVGDRSDDLVLEREFRAIPNIDGEVDTLTVDINTVTGSDYGFVVDIYAVQETPDGTVNEGTLIKDDWDPDFTSGEQTIPLDTTFSVSNGENWTIEFVTQSSDNDGANDQIEIRLDENSDMPVDDNWAWLESGGPFDWGADMDLSGVGDSGIYISQTHSVDNASTGFTNVTLNNATAEVSWLADTDDDGTFETTAGSSSFSTTGNHTIDVSGTDSTDWRVNVTFVRTGTNPTAELHDEGLQFTNHEPLINNSSATPTGDLSTSSHTLEIDINDTEFPTAQGDSVDVEFFLDGSSIGTDTLTSNGTASQSVSGLTGGEHTWNVTATDSYGLSNTSDTFTISTPANISIRNETGNHELISGPGISVDGRFYSGELIFEKNTTNGVINMTGLPVDRTYIFTVNADGYYPRTVIIDSLFNQTSVYMLNQSHTAYFTEFTINDQTGDFPASSSTIFVDKAINQTDSDSFEWVTITGDTFGAEGSFKTYLQNSSRYNISIRNQDGEVAQLGPYVAESAGVKELTVTEQDRIQVDELGAITSFRPSAGFVDATDATVLNATIRSDENELSSYTWTVNHTNTSGTFTLVSLSGAEADGETLGATVNLTGLTEGQLESKLEYTLTSGSPQTVSRTYLISDNLGGQHTLLSIVGDVGTLIPAATFDIFAALAALVLTALAVAAAGQMQLSTESVGLLAVGVVGVFAVFGWFEWDLFFAAGAAFVAVAGLRWVS